MFVNNGLTTTSFFTTHSLKQKDTKSSSVVNKIQSAVPRIIFLTGTTTAGKSSIMAAFAKEYQNTIERGVDEFEETRCANLIKENFLADYNTLSEAFDDKTLFRLIHLYYV